MEIQKHFPKIEKVKAEKVQFSNEVNAIALMQRYCIHILCYSERSLIKNILFVLYWYCLAVENKISFSRKFRICFNVRSDLLFFSLTLFAADIYFLQTCSDLSISGVHMLIRITYVHHVGLSNFYVCFRLKFFFRYCKRFPALAFKL